MSKKKWTAGDRIAVLVQKIDPSFACPGQVHLTISGDDSNYYYISEDQRSLVRLDSICVLERVRKKNFLEPEWRVVTHELQKRD